MSAGACVDELGRSVLDKFFEFVETDVDMFHASVKDWVFGSFDATDVVFVEHSGYFGVEELGGESRSGNVLCN